jgi:hypothetical protein
LQNTPSSHGAVFGVWAHAPAPLQASLVQGFASLLQAVPTTRLHVSAVSLQAFAHSPPSAHGLPVCREQNPPLHASLPLQNAPSLHVAPSGSAAVQESVASLHDSLQSASASGPAQGLPAWSEQDPPEHKSAPLQNRLSLHEDVLLVTTHVPVALH